MPAVKKKILASISLLAIAIIAINVHLIPSRNCNHGLQQTQASDDASRDPETDKHIAATVSRRVPSSLTKQTKQLPKFVHSYEAGHEAIKRMQNESLYFIQKDNRLPLMQLTEIERDVKYRTKMGKQWMRDRAVVFVGTARNAKEQLPRNIDDIHRLGKLFKDYWMVFVENDSKDGTRDYLMGVLKQYNQTVILGCEPINSPAECRLNIKYRSGKLHKPGWALKRNDDEEVDRGVTMSVLRNMILDFIYSNLADKVDLMIGIEPDISWDPWNLDNIAQGIYYFSARPQLDLLCANGRLWGKLYDPCSRTYYSKKHFLSAAEEDRSVITDDVAIEKNKVPIKVDSCYQAFAIYRISSLVRYNAHYYPVPGEWNCEHNTLARRLSERYIDPEMFLNIYSLVVHSRDRW